MLTLVLNDDLNDNLTELNGETVLLVDDGGIDGNYGDNKMLATALQFNVPYSIRILLETEANWDYLGLFKNRYQNLQFDLNLTPERFKYDFGTEGEPDIRAPSDDYIISESGEKTLEYTYGAGEIITVAFGSDQNTNLRGFRIIMMPTNTYVLSDVDLLLSDFPADFFQGRVVTESKFGGEVTGYDFANCLFRNCEFSEAQIVDSSLEATNFEECNCRNVTLRGITVDANTSFDDKCTLRSIFGVDIVGTTIRLPKGYEIRAGHFFGPFTSHDGKTFEEVDLQGVDFTNSNILGTDLSLALLGNNRSAGIRSGVGTAMTVIKDDSDFFGSHMSLSSDGSILAVGAPRKPISSADGSTTRYAGIVKVYKYEGLWQQLGEDINVESPIFADQFGYSVALNADGTRLLVGAVQHSSRKGFAKVYKFEQDTWTQVGSTIEGTGDEDRAGIDVDISRDGVRIAIGAFQDNNDTTNVSNSGSISVYQLIDDDWDLVNSKIESEDADDLLGSQVNISSDGTVVLGVLGASRGEARVYADKGGAWTLKGDAIPTAGRATLAGTGDVVFVTLQNEEGTYSVQAYKFQDGNWREHGSPMGRDRNLGIIDSVCTTADGLHLLFHERQANGSQVFLYQWDGEDWSLKLDPIAAKTTQPLVKTTFSFNEISDSGNVFTIGDYDDNFVEIFQLSETILPDDYAILDNFLVKTTFGSNSETILAAAPELADATLRDPYLSAVLKNMTPGSDRLIAPSSALGSSFLDVNRPLTRIIGADSLTRIDPDIENNIYVIATDGDSFTAGIRGTPGAVLERDGSNLKISYLGRRYSLGKGKSVIIDGYVKILNGSIFIIYLRRGTICFDGSELVETDQGYVPIRKIDKSIHTIRQQPIQQISCTRCADNQMVRIHKNAFGKATPNKDTLVTLKHKIYYRGTMKPAATFVGRKGISLVKSHNQVVFNVMLPTHTYMRVNNMLTETLHPDCEL